MCGYVSKVQTAIGSKGVKNGPALSDRYGKFSRLAKTNFQHEKVLCGLSLMGGGEGH